MNLRAIDICSGAGGWACAARGLPIDIVLAVDLWDVACKTYELNHPDTQVLCADIRDRETQDRIAGYGVDLLLGGIPCEWLSAYRNVGHKKGRVSDEERRNQRRTLDAALALVDRLRPRWWCFEDVARLKRELPPLTPYLELDAADFSPQRRKRIYVGNFPRPRAEKNTQTASAELRSGPYRIGKSAFGRTASRSKSFTPETIYPISADRKAPTICAISSRRDSELAVVAPGLPGGLRQLEWQEAARLQGFPTDYLFYGSPTAVSLMVGRAVQLNTASAILHAIVKEAHFTTKNTKNPVGK